MKALLYVQHLLGTGHVRRAALLARALANRDVNVTVAYGGFPVSGVDFGPARIVPLPPARAADAAFSAVLDAEGRPIGEAWKGARRDALLALFLRQEADILLIETFPFGRRQFRFELAPLLDAARDARPRPVIASSVRDILIRKADPKKHDDMAAMARRWFDLVLVHGDPAFIPFEATFPPAPAIADLIRYTGYVAPDRDPPAPPGDDGHGEVVVSVGGGAVGFDLLRTTLRARPMSAAAHRRWRLLLGADLAPEHIAALRDMAAAQGPGVILEPARPDFPGLLGRCLLSISQAGYNTVMDILKAGCRAIVVPFAAGGETEQAERAWRLADRGLLAVLEEAALTPQALAEAVDNVLAGPPPAAAAPGLPVDGAARSAALLIDYARKAAAAPI
ncbi:MAG: glycosyltransferase [Alphaproteobacteria bacterium]|jgi:predicted glycosyltransferase|nr:glycosyltransferase [Alphaproteobacteria bacterium]